MKIAYVNKTRWLSNIPGTVFSTLNTYGFAQNGIDSTLFMIDPLENVDQSFSEYFDLPALDNFHVITFSKKLGLIESNKIFYDRTTKHIVKKNDFDVVITRDPGFLTFLIKIKKKTNCKIFYQSHNFYLDLSLKDDPNEVNAKRFNKLESKYVKHIDGLLALNNPQKELYEKYVDVPVFAGKPGLKEVKKSQDNFDKKIIFYSGSFQLKKGLDDLLDAYKIMKTNAKLILAGGRNDNELELMKNIIKEKNIEKEVEITGWMDYASLLDRLSDATIGVIPLKNTFYNRYLTAPSKLFDYLSFGVPVIASELPSIIDLIEKDTNGLFYEANNSQQLAEKLETILSNRNIYEKIRLNNIKKAEEYLWQNRTSAMLEFIKSV